MSSTAPSTPRLTAHQQSVLAAVRRLERFASAHDVHAALHAARSSISLATVYRSLHLLHDLHLVDSIQRDGETLHRRCRSRPHDHLMCDSCSRTVELDRSDVLPLLLERQARRAGFGYVTYALEVTGRCSECAGADAIS